MKKSEEDAELVKTLSQIKRELDEVREHSDNINSQYDAQKIAYEAVLDELSKSKQEHEDDKQLVQMLNDQLKALQLKSA